MNDRGVLVYMCAVAIDTDDPPRYWGGHDAIARYALGRRVDDTLTAAEAQKQRRSIAESTRRAIKSLVARGALKLVGPGEQGHYAFPGHNQEYEIRVETLSAVNDTLGHLSTTDQGVVNDRLSMSQSHVGAETKNTNTNREHQDHLTGQPHLRLVKKASNA
jgi:hypothetical protein